MKINYKDKEIEVKYGFRALMMYENITDKSFNPQNISDIINFFYSCVLVQTMNDEPVKYDEFIDWLDEDPMRLNDFCLWLTDIVNINNDIAPKANKIAKKSKTNKSKN